MNSLTKAGIAAVLSLGAIGAFSTTASAQDLQLRIGPGENGRPAIRMDNGRSSGNMDNGCSPGEARAAARDEGFSRPQIVRTTSRSVTVQGWTQDGQDRITFANRPGCPVI